MTDGTHCQSFLFCFLELVNQNTTAKVMET